MQTQISQLVLKKMSAMSAKALLIFATMAVVFVSMAEATPNKFRKLLWSFLKK